MKPDDHNLLLAWPKHKVARAWDQILLGNYELHEAGSISYVTNGHLGARLRSHLSQIQGAVDRFSVVLKY